jgi:hypothetical protein
MDIQDQQEIITKIREEYSLIFNWLKESGEDAVKKRKSLNKWGSYDEERYEIYKSLVQNLVKPGIASVESMYEIARQVVMGIFETYYTEKVDDRVLGVIGKSILNLYKVLETIYENEKWKDTAYEVIDNDFSIDDDISYFERAAIVYDVIFSDNERNIGGKVALTDTNWEIHKLLKNEKKLIFRKPELMHFKQLNEGSNLFEKAFNNEIIITSINVKE